MIEFIPVAHFIDEHVALLWRLLGEREAQQNISHKRMPSPQEHYNFVASYPYLEWHIINIISGNGSQVTPIGSIYLTINREIGLSILASERRKGYGKAALQMFMDMYKDPDKPYLANINPANEASIKLFESLGFNHIQNTYYRLDHE